MRESDPLDSRLGWLNHSSPLVLQVCIARGSSGRTTVTSTSTPLKDNILHFGPLQILWDGHTATIIFRPRTLTYMLWVHVVPMQTPRPCSIRVEGTPVGLF